MKRGSFLDRIISLVYPDTCPYCGKIIDSSKTKCEQCEKAMKYTFSTRKIFDDVICISPFSYRGKVREAIHKFKFKGYKRYGWNFAMEIVKTIKIELPDKKFSVVTSVPLCKKREKDRGFNQSKSLAIEVGSALNIPFEDLLEKIKGNNPQHEVKTLQERIENVKNVYKSKYQCGGQKNTIILCDDIVTSGNTLKECVKVLKNSKFNNILCVTIANADKKWDNLQI